MVLSTHTKVTYIVTIERGGDPMDASIYYDELPVARQAIQNFIRLGYNREALGLKELTVVHRTVNLPLEG